MITEKKERTDKMALFHLLMVMLIIPLIIIGIIGMLVGLILLIVGIINRKKPANQGKRFPKVFITIGSILLIVPFLTTSALVISSVVSIFRSYDSLPDRWNNIWISDSMASDDAVKALTNAAGKGDREALAKCFSADVRKDPDFDKMLDEFIQNYPTEISQCELDGSSSGSSASYDYGHVVKTGGGHYECDHNGERYFFNLYFCHENTDEPDKVGVTWFSVTNIEAQAKKSAEYDPIDNEDPRGMECLIISSDEVNAKLIGGVPYLWEPTPDKKFSEDEMRKLLSGAASMEDVYAAAGTPNASYKAFNSTGYEYFYELRSSEKEPRYANICASSPKGYIIDAYVCTPDETIYDNPLKEFEKPKDED